MNDLENDLKKIERNPDPPTGGEGSPHYEAHYPRVVSE